MCLSCLICFSAESILSICNYKVSQFCSQLQFLQFGGHLLPKYTYSWSMWGSVSSSRKLQQKGLKDQTANLAINLLCQLSSANMLNSSSNLTVNLSSTGVQHITDAHSVLLRSLRPILSGDSSAELFLPLQPDLSALCTLHFISYICLWTVLCYRL